jgi:SAM-dependent methyltransferase
MNQNRIWSYFQDERIEVFSQSNSRLRYLADRAQKLVRSPSPLALNIGVGNGFLEDYLTKQGWRIRSLDPSKAPMKRLRKKGLEADVGCIEALPYKDKTFDVVFCSEVLEHLSSEQLEIGLKEVCRVLKPEGYFIGTVPDQENLNDNIVICPGCGHIFHRWGHQQWFDQKGLYELFPKCWEILVVKTKLFINWKGLNLKRRVAAFIKLLLFYLGSHGSNETLYFLVKKLP